MNPIETFWTVTAPKLAEKWPDDFTGVFHKAPCMICTITGGNMQTQFVLFDAPNIQQCHDIAEAIGVVVWCEHMHLDMSPSWRGYYRIDAERPLVMAHPHYPTAPLAALAALNAAVEEVTR